MLQKKCFMRCNNTYFYQINITIIYNNHTNKAGHTFCKLILQCLHALLTCLKTTYFAIFDKKVTCKRVEKESDISHVRFLKTIYNEITYESNADLANSIIC